MCKFLVFLIAIGLTPCFSQTKTLWNGEVNALSCNADYGSVISGGDAYDGSVCFRAEPDKFHVPKLGFNCSDAWRADISGFDELRFFIKANQSGQTTSIRLTTYFAQSNWVDLEHYVQGGGGIMTDYKEVRIPLNVLKKPNYDLSSIEYFEVATTTIDQLFFYMDNIQAVDLLSPVLTLQPVSDQVLKVRISERFDTTGCHNVLNYMLKSETDGTYKIAQNPVKVGRHHLVTGLLPESGAPIVDYELFLIFNKPLTAGSVYSLTVNEVKDLSGNGAAFDTIFIYNDLEIYGNVKANQVGYLPVGPKLGKLGNFLGDAWFMPVDTVITPVFQVRNELEQVVFSKTSRFLKADSAFSGELVFDLDFSDFTTPGSYYLYVEGCGRSETFSIADDVYDNLHKQSARALYFQRSGKLDAPYAENWQRGGLPATTAEIHASHASSPLNNVSDFPVGTSIPMTKGWLDAGDYGRYVPTAASALFILFTALELYPQKFPDNYYNIPESDNNIPDILDEIKYETDWLKQMQAPDGGVYFRVTPATWSAGLPEEELSTLYVSEKTTQSTALFAAAMAMAARNFKKYLPSYADNCLDMAKEAWAFLQLHPETSPVLNVPGIAAGPYPDPIDLDNRAWAAAELYKTTGEQIYNTAFLNCYAQIPHQFHATMSWSQHTFKAAWAYATTKYPVDNVPVAEFKSKLDSEVLVNYNKRTMNIHAYHGAYHPFKGYIGYGTFGMAQSYAFDYIMFSYLLSKPELLDLAKIQLDIPLGNNPLSKTMITGVGKNSPKLPLHWSTVKDKFTEPAPGIPVFGPAASLVMNRPSSFAIQDSANRYPYGFKKEDPYPVLRRYTDTREAVEMSEFTIQEIAVTIAPFAFFSTAVNDALPVRFESFEARVEQCHVNLHWATSEEINAAYFIVQRSSDGISFDDIGRINATGSGKVQQQYTFPDSLPDLQNYYRLRQVDFDGKCQVTRIIYARDPCNGIKINVLQRQQNIYEIHIKSHRKESMLKGEIIDKRGILRRKFDVKASEATRFDTFGLPDDLYILQIKNQSGYRLFSQKMIVQ
ncbi:glycoside hydrolase family 9 protein [Dyadobacter chenwenxiniae]|uniref:Glycoside hydrolase family 9 protein n=1 Tax=Dyadobacter chenwenxiniae TaxID=2906456 RepID=A0A9X1PGB5_9BACT|nr:glycoside hydrolase family 9 protein [Dyadobacter chenwenxiniae]MCF0060203.1 glycoside hydrolase family 9 protein [Dyadobacter chenwenxiniae]UON85940.1 glycoside hydrolase family 9 protein [Dyadobacter chenwenxiniae]